MPLQISCSTHPAINKRNKTEEFTPHQHILLDIYIIANQIRLFFSKIRKYNPPARGIEPGTEDYPSMILSSGQIC